MNRDKSAAKYIVSAFVYGSVPFKHVGCKSFLVHRSKFLLEFGCLKLKIKRHALILAGYLPPCYFKEYTKERVKAGGAFLTGS